MGDITVAKSQLIEKGTRPGCLTVWYSSRLQNILLTSGYARHHGRACVRCNYPSGQSSSWDLGIGYAYLGNLSRDACIKPLLGD